VLGRSIDMYSERTSQPVARVVDVLRSLDQATIAQYSMPIALEHFENEGVVTFESIFDNIQVRLNAMVQVLNAAAAATEPDKLVSVEDVCKEIDRLEAIHMAFRIMPDEFLRPMADQVAARGPEAYRIFIESRFEPLLAQLYLAHEYTLVFVLYAKLASFAPPELDDYMVIRIAAFCHQMNVDLAKDKNATATTAKLEEFMGDRLACPLVPLIKAGNKNIIWRRARENLTQAQQSFPKKERGRTVKIEDANKYSDNLLSSLQVRSCCTNRKEVPKPCLIMQNIFEMVAELFGRPELLFQIVAMGHPLGMRLATPLSPISFGLIGVQPPESKPVDKSSLSSSASASQRVGNVIQTSTSTFVTSVSDGAAAQAPSSGPVTPVSPNPRFFSRFSKGYGSNATPPPAPTTAAPTTAIPVSPPQTAQGKGAASPLASPVVAEQEPLQKYSYDDWVSQVESANHWLQLVPSLSSFGESYYAEMYCWLGLVGSAPDGQARVDPSRSVGAPAQRRVRLHHRGRAVQVAATTAGRDHV